MVFNIYGAKIKVVREDLTSEKALGLYDPEAKQISICIHCPPDKLRMVLIHELLHAIWDRLGVFNMPGHNEQVEEILVSNIANILSECGLFAEEEKCKKKSSTSRKS